MGLDAEVIAIGAFSRDIVGAMEYHPDYYASVENGQFVLVRSMHVPIPAWSSAKISDTREAASTSGADA